MRLLRVSERPDYRSPRGKVFLAALGVASIVILGLFLYSPGISNPPAPTSGVTTTTATSYSVAASAVIASAAARAPDGFAGGFVRQLSPIESGLVGGGYGSFFTHGGSLANLTVLVFVSPDSAQTYISSVITNSKALSGYTDISARLANYLQYGVCYGFGQTDPDGNGAVATGVCTKGNVYIQVHVVAPSSLSSAQAEMSDLVGAAYQGIG
jgi:hypothetical protein